MLEEYEVPDDDIEMESNFTQAQRHILANKTPLQADAREFNNPEFRAAYLRE